MYALHCTEGLLIILTAEDESEELIVPGSLCNGPLKKVTPNKFLCSLQSFNLVTRTILASHGFKRGSH